VLQTDHTALREYPWAFPIEIGGMVLVFLVTPVSQVFQTHSSLMMVIKYFDGHYCSHHDHMDSCNQVLFFGQRETLYLQLGMLFVYPIWFLIRWLVVPKSISLSSIRISISKLLILLRKYSSRS